MDSRCAVCSTGFGNSSMRSLGFDHSSIGHFMALLRPTLNLACTSTCLQCGLQFGGRMRAHRMSKLGFLPRGAGCALAPVKPCQTLPPRGGGRSVRDPSREPRPRSGRPSVWHDGARVAALPMHALGRGPGRHRARAVGASLAPGTASSRSAVARCVLGPERPAVARGVLGSGRLEVGRSSVQGAAVRARSALAGLLGSVRRFAMMTLTALAFCPMHAARTDRSLADPRSCSPTPALAAIVRCPGHHRRSHVPARLAISGFDR